jgi:hypothetical protein
MSLNTCNTIQLIKPLLYLIQVDFFPQYVWLIEYFTSLSTIFSAVYCGGQQAILPRKQMSVSKQGVNFLNTPWQLLQDIQHFLKDSIYDIWSIAITNNPIIFKLYIISNEYSSPPSPLIKPTLAMNKWTFKR